MTETPRTDAEESEKMNMPGTVPADFARELERENAALREDKDRLDWIESRRRTEFEGESPGVWCITKGERGFADYSYPYRFTGGLRASIDAARRASP